MKTIWIINQASGSRKHGMVFRSYYLAEELIKRGHAVTIFAASFSHTLSSLPQTNGRFTEEFIDGIQYFWVRTRSYPQSRSVGRIIAMFEFLFKLLTFNIFSIKKPDVIIISSPPPISIFVAFFWAKIFGAKLCFEVRDIWPLSIQRLGGFSKWHPFIMFLSFVEWFAYKFSDEVITVLEGAENHIVQAGGKKGHVHYLPNGIEETAKPALQSETAESISKLRLGKFVIGYTGSLGVANAMLNFVDIAISAKTNPKYVFVVVGKGPDLELMKERSLNEKLENIFFFAPVPKNEIPLIIEQFDLCYIGFKNTQLYEHGISPNKIFDYMLAAKPILIVINSKYNLVDQAKCGIVCRDFHPEKIYQVIEEVSCKDEVQKNMGLRGKDYVLSNHVYSNITTKLMTIFFGMKDEALSNRRWVTSPFWLGFWIVFLLGGIVQGVLPIFFPDLFVDGISIFLKDPHYSHEMAIRGASLPWAEINLWPSGQFPAGVLTVLYKAFGIYKPFLCLPILGILAGLTIRGIASCLDVLGVSGRWWPILIGITYALTPTSLSWMIYPHVDSFIVPGVVLITWAFMAVAQRSILLRHFAALLIGSFLVFSNKPYFAELFFAGTILVVPFAGWRAPRGKRLSFLLCALILFGGLSLMNENNSNTINTPESWKNIPIGRNANNLMFSIAHSREQFLVEHSYGQTNFMPEVHLEGTWDAIQFIPRAFQLALIEPLPWRQIEGKRAKEIIFIAAKFEMILVYLSLIFLITSGRKSWSPAVLISIALSIPFLLTLGFTTPNIGLINRYRFPFLLLIKLAGFAALWNSSRFKWPGRLLMWVDPPVIDRPRKKVLFLVVDSMAFYVQRLVMAKGVQAAGYEVHVAGADAGAVDKIEELGFTFHKMDLNRGGINPFADLIPFIKLVFFLAKQRPDILQCVSIKQVLYGATAGTIVGLKHIVCLINGLGYAFEGNDFKGKVIKKIAIALYQNALALSGIRVIFQNPDDQNYFIENKIVEKEKTVLIRGSGVDMTKFAPTPQPNNDVPVVLFVGRLLKSKGIFDLIEAAKLLKGEGIKFTLRVVGEPDDRNPEAISKEEITKLHKEGIVDWVGRQSDMPKFYREADIICLPTLYKEGLPLTLLEAASIGRALIATDVPGCREIVRNGENGYLVRPHSKTDLENALRKIISDKDLRIKMGDCSSNIIRDEFAAEIIQRELTRLYKNV